MEKKIAFEISILIVYYTDRSKTSEGTGGGEYYSELDMDISCLLTIECSIFQD